MYKYTKIKLLLEHLDEFEHIHPEGSMKEFSLWFRDQIHGMGASEKISINDFSDRKTFRITDRPEVELSTLVTNLYRFSRHYIKKALDKTGLRTVDEFGFLATLIQEGSLLKSELINMHLIEISSGTEVLKRLLKSGYIFESPDPNDGRAKRVALTEEGRDEIIHAFSEMHKVSLIVNGNISKEEQKQVIMTFNKLKYFHWNIHKHDRDTNLDDLLAKYLGKSH